MKKIIPFILGLVVLAGCGKVENQNQETIQNSSSSVSNGAIISSSISFNSKNNGKTFVVPSEINIDGNKLDLMPVPQNSSNFGADESYYYGYKKENGAVGISSGQPSFGIEKISNKFLGKKINSLQDLYNRDLEISIGKNLTGEMFNFESLKSDGIDKTKIFWENKTKDYIEVAILDGNSPYYLVNCYFKDNENYFRAQYSSPISNINGGYTNSEKEKHFENVIKEGKIQSLKLKGKICSEGMKNIKNSGEQYQIPKLIKYKNQDYNFLYKNFVPDMGETNGFLLTGAKDPLKDGAIMIISMGDKIKDEKIISLNFLAKKMIEGITGEKEVFEGRGYIEVGLVDKNQFGILCLFNREKNYYMGTFTAENQAEKSYLENYKKEKGQFCKAILVS